MICKQWLVNVFFLSALICHVNADTWYVHPDGSADPNGSATSPFSTIQSAIDEASQGDTIILQLGTYKGAGNFNIDPDGLILTICSSEPLDPAVTRNTIIDPNGQGGGFIFHSGEDPNFLLSGITIKNATGDHGTAVSCIASSPTIKNCVFVNNQSIGAGGAVYYENATAEMSNCLFLFNRGYNGGAIAVNQYSDLTIDNCTLAGNKATFYGGGILCQFSSTVTLKNSILWGNLLDQAPSGGKQASARFESNLTVSYSNIEEGLAGIQNFGSTVNWSEGNLNADPNFVSYSANADLDTVDLHLISEYGRWDKQTADWTNDPFTSVCINAGDPNESYTMEPWPNGRLLNIGYYANTIEASKFGNEADFDISGKTDIDDLNIIITSWLTIPLDYEDLNANGIVDMPDFERFAKHWLWEMPGTIE